MDHWRPAVVSEAYAMHLRYLRVDQAKRPKPYCCVTPCDSVFVSR
jgi:hypothetical protein